MSEQKRTYPADFVAAAKIEYPDWTALHKALDEGNASVGHYLIEPASGSLDATMVMNMIDNDEVQNLRELAAKQVRRQELYARWSEIYDGAAA